MLRVSGLIRNDHGEIGDDGGDEIENRMQRFGQNSQAAGDDREKHLERYENHSGTDGSERRHAFFAGGLFESFRHDWADYTPALAGRENRREGSIRIAR